MIIARASLGLDPTLSPLGNPLAENYQDLLRTSKKSNRNNLAKVECLLQLIMGLQNDIIGIFFPFSSCHYLYITKYHSNKTEKKKNRLGKRPQNRNPPKHNPNPNKGWEKADKSPSPSDSDAQRTSRTPSKVRRLGLVRDL